jgi:hypothetical protein
MVMAPLHNISGLLQRCIFADAYILHTLELLAPTYLQLPGPSGPPQATTNLSSIISC